jgi:autotransporter passenger strand-loop-strand repeat protein
VVISEVDQSVYVSSGQTDSRATIESGAAEVIGSGGKAIDSVVDDAEQYVLSGGSAVGATVSSGGAEIVRGVASGTKVLSGGSGYIYAGGVASGLALAAGGVAIDDGQVLIAGAGTLAGTLSGSGAVVETGGGDLLLSGAGAAFDGRAVISGGTIELAKSGALGTGYVQFVEPSTGSAVLQIDAADAPAAGGTFANVISNFSGAHEDIDLRSIAFVSGASATVSSSTLILTDGGKTYKFKLAGSMAGAYPVLSDGHGGTLIDPITAAPKTTDPTVLAFAHTAAAFAPSDAANSALVSSTSPIGETPFLHATASATAGPA